MTDVYAFKNENYTMIKLKNAKVLKRTEKRVNLSNESRCQIEMK